MACKSNLTSDLTSDKPITLRKSSPITLRKSSKSLASRNLPITDLPAAEGVLFDHQANADVVSNIETGRVNLQPGKPASDRVPRSD